MKKVCLSLLSLLTVSAFADPVVSNIRAAQRENTKLVDILYDVSYSGGSNVSVTCEVSTNSGATYTVPAKSFSGTGYGAIVTIGNDRLITWNAGVDWNEKYSEQVKVRITAKAPRFTINHAVGTDYQYDDNGNIVATNYYTVDVDVTDNETGLVWQLWPASFNIITNGIIILPQGQYTNSIGSYWYNASVNKTTWIVVNDMGGEWRLPTRAEFRSLLDTNRTPALPAGHPFGTVAAGLYWTASATSISTPSEIVPSAWCVSVMDGYEVALPQTSSARAWLVRSIY